MHPTPFCFNFVTLFHLHSHHCPALLTYHYTLHHVFWALIKDHFSLVGMPIYRNFHVYKRFCFFHMAFSKWWYFTLFRSTKHDSLRTINKGPTNQKQRGNEKSQQHQHFVTFFLFSGPVAKNRFFHYQNTQPPCVCRLGISTQASSFPVGWGHQGFGHSGHLKIRQAFQQR